MACGCRRLRGDSQQSLTLPPWHRHPSLNSPLSTPLTHLFLPYEGGGKAWGVRVSGFGFRVAGFGFRVWGAPRMCRCRPRSCCGSRSAPPPRPCVVGEGLMPSASHLKERLQFPYMGTSLIKTCFLLGPYSRPMPRAPVWS